MLTHLLDHDQDFELQCPPPWNAAALIQDLGLEAVFRAMAGSDALALETAKTVLLHGPENNPATIRYRQDILRNCLGHADAVRELYAVAAEAVETEKKHYLGVLARHPDWVVRLSVEQLETFLETLQKLRKFADAQASQFSASGWTALLTGVQRELDDPFFGRFTHLLEQLKFRQGIQLGARLGAGNKGTSYSLLRPRPGGKKGWRTKLFGQRPPTADFSLDPRDESGIRALEELQNCGLATTANTLAGMVRHVHDFFHRLRIELAFYIGCLNLHEHLTRIGETVCFPEPMAAGENRLSFRELYDAGLALRLDQRVTGNSVDADRQDLVMVTGANQGGKTTFLRSVGLAQLMMQAGMFVPAESFRASVRDGLFTHYKREEDAGMKSGKLDEELGRMSEITGHLTPHAMILFNESFAATNEREGAEIARQILTALLEQRIKMVCVTHLHELAQGFYQREGNRTLFLRAERQADGTRTFSLIQGEPLPTSFGEDLYCRIFGAA